jgi:antitoxin component of RelBE/YafQ-DinJ toxin-antitoxin module
MSIVSVRIDEKTKKALEKAGINLSKEVKKFIEDLAWEVERKERLNVLKRELENMKPPRKGFSEESVREDRESH